MRWCATVQPFRTPDAAAWSAQHGFALGDVVPLDRVLALARVWYGRHLDPSWRKWTLDEVRAMFASVGLTSSTWDVPPAAARFLTQGSMRSSWRVDPVRERLGAPGA